MWKELIAYVVICRSRKKIKLQVVIADHYDFHESHDFWMKVLTMKAFALLLFFQMRKLIHTLI